jgi:hypothetical protein
MRPCWSILLFWSFVAANIAAETNGYSPVAISNHLASVKAKAPRGFSVLWEPPFAIAGDAPEVVLRRVVTDTVRWATTRLKAEYFPREPKPFIDIWLFGSDASYRHHARVLFNDTPDTPFGYYSPKNRALIMNISTGGGTLIHEMVHAFMSANFEECPSWFNEGLASLYEQCGEEKGHIHGYPNWRLPKLQEAIRAGKVPSFAKLTAMSSDEFYGRTTGAAYNQQYAQARYLCYYLQERGLLGKFYREFHDHVRTDPTGYNSLRKVLGETDMNAFQKKWEKFVLSLRAP